MLTIADILLAIIGMVRRTGLIVVAFAKKHEAKLYINLRLRRYKKVINDSLKQYSTTLNNRQNITHNTTISGKLKTIDIFLHTNNIRVKLHTQSPQKATYRKRYFDDLRYPKANVHNLTSR